MKSDPLSGEGPPVASTVPGDVGAAGAPPSAEAAHDHAWRSVTVGNVHTYSDYECSVCGITWSL